MKQKKINFSLFIILYNLLFTLFLIGALLNLMAIINNDCKMPVLNANPELIAMSNRHSLFTDKSEVKFYYFTDIFKINQNYYSIGDILMRGVSGLVISLNLVLTYIYINNRIWKKEK